MGIVGSREEAKLIYDWSLDFAAMHDYWDTWDIEESLPEGWMCLGQGMYRVAFRSPSGVCYKVEKDSESHYGQSNFEEYENYVRLLNVTMPEHSRLPAYTFYKMDAKEWHYGGAKILGVSAMECIEGETLYDFGEPDEDMELMYKIRRRCRLNDVHSGNVMKEYRTGDLVLVDIGA